MAELRLERDPWKYGQWHEPVGRELFPLEKAETVIGRSAPADIILPDFSIARKEAKIVREGGTYVLVGMRFGNGTFVNGVWIGFLPRHSLRTGDEVDLLAGRYRLRFYDRDAGSSESTTDTSPRRPRREYFTPDYSALKDLESSEMTDQRLTLELKKQIQQFLKKTEPPAAQSDGP